MKLFLCFIFIISYTFSALSQSNNTYYGFEEVYELGPMWGFYGTNYLNGPAVGMGNTGLASLNNGVSGIQLNPATLNIKNRFEVNAQFNYKFGMRESYLTPIWDKIDNKYNSLFPSGSIAAGYRATKFLSLGLYYSNISSFHNIWGTDTYYINNVTILTGDLTRTFSIHRFGIPIVLTYKAFNLGVSLEYSYYRTDIGGLPPTSSNPNELSTAYAKANNINLRFGFIALLAKEFSLGASITPPFSLDYKSTLPHISTEYLGLPEYPLIINTGIQYKWNNLPLRFCFDYTFTGKTDNSVIAKNISDINMGVEYIINKKYKVRLGYFTEYSVDKYSFDYDQVFLTTGLGYEIKKYSIDLAIMDSHISTGIIKNTIIQTSLCYNY